MERLKSAGWLAARAVGAKVLLDYWFGTEPVILMYHRFSRAPAPDRVSEVQFEQQLCFLNAHCTVISMQELVLGLSYGRKWQPGTVVVTIDDGYRDVYEIAFPLIQRYQVPFTIFITSGFAEGRLWHWPDKLHYMLSMIERRTNTVRLNGVAVELGGPGGLSGRAAWHLVADYCFKLSEEDCQEFVREMSSQLRIPVPDAPPERYASVSWDEIRRMCHAGIQIGAHSVTHARLAPLPTERIRYELVESKRMIESRIDRECSSFAYPYGGPEDQTEIAHALVREAGYSAGCVAYFDAKLLEDRFALRRFGVGRGGWDFVKIVEGLKRANCLYRSRRRLSRQ